MFFVLLNWSKVQPNNIFRADGSFAQRKSSGGTIHIVASGFNPMDNKIIKMDFKVLKY